MLGHVTPSTNGQLYTIKINKDFLMKTLTDGGFHTLDRNVTLQIINKLWRRESSPERSMHGSYNVFLGKNITCKYIKWLSNIIRMKLSRGQKLHKIKTKFKVKICIFAYKLTGLVKFPKFCILNLFLGCLLTLYRELYNVNNVIT